jgi:histidinol dehydrogenase
MGTVMNRLDLRGVDDLAGRLPRPDLGADEPVAAVRAILADVRASGDVALRELTARFDGVAVDDLAVPHDELKRSLDAIDPEVRGALEVAAANIRAFHESQLVAPHRFERDGVVVEGRRQAVDRAGIYVPGGRAAYPSTVLMTAVPARVAGVGEIALCVPPGPDGRVADVVLAAAALADVDEVYRVGGAQAIAAFAYGTDTIAPVDVISGPGNLYVAIAKREVSGTVGVPSAFAGPSEVVVVADDTSPVDWAAVDVILQAEHGPNGLAWLLTWSPDAAARIDAAIAEQVAAAPRRADIEATLAEGGYVVLVDGPEQAAAVANRIAPEHLEVMTADPDAVISLVRHAGAVFRGPLATAALGDYAAGPSHVLPTFGSARFSGALTVDDFQKAIHVVSVDQAGFDRLAPVVETHAEAEGIDAHAESVRLLVRGDR